MLSTGELLFVGIFVFYAIVFSYIFTLSVNWKLKRYKIDTERAFKYLEESLQRDLKHLKEENVDLRDQLRKINCKK